MTKLQDRTLSRSYFHDALTALTERAARTTLSRVRPRNQLLYRHLLEVFESVSGSPGSFVADPVFEPMFGWEEVPETMDSLAGSLLHERTVDALDSPRRPTERPHQFDRSWHPRTHQLEAWRTLQQTPPQSAIIASGTGSGKTECFMVPVIDDIVREVEAEGYDPGVRALFLYPLNALIASQRDRLRAWTSALKGDVRFALYNGMTPETSSKLGNINPSHFPEEAMYRSAIRENTPQILVTNPTMLEHILLRRRDKKLLDASKGKLRWIVIDEAHTFVGSQAAELAMLLRRTIRAFESRPEDIRFVATSATIGSDADHDSLRKYLAELGDININRVSFITGKRKPVHLPDVESATSTLPTRDEMETADETARFQALVHSTPFRRLFDEMAGQGARALTLSEVSRSLGLRDSRDDSNAHRAALRILDAARDARQGPKAPYLLPLRLHTHVRTQPGLWTCTLPSCSGKPHQLKNEQDGWPWGPVFLSQRQSCPHCESVVHEVVVCPTCGDESLLVNLAADYSSEGPMVWQETTKSRFTADDYTIGESEDDVDSESDANADGELIGSQGEPVLNTLRHCSLQAADGFFNAATGRLYATPRAPDVHPVSLGVKNPDGAPTPCPVCTRSTAPEFMRRFAAGRELLLPGVAQTALEHTPPLDSTSAPQLPMDGRRLLTFSDSRQGTARFALRLQIESERETARQAIMNALLATRADKKAERAALTQTIEALRASPLANPALASLVADSEAKLLKLDEPVCLDWRDLRTSIMTSNDAKQIAEKYEQGIRSDIVDRGADLLLHREFSMLTRRAYTLETGGMVRVNYPQLASIPRAPSGFVAACVRAKLAHLGTVDAWRTLLAFLLDESRSLPVTRMDHWVRNAIGTRVPPLRFMRPGREANIRAQAEYTSTLRAWWSKPPEVKGRPPRVKAVLAAALNTTPTSTDLKQVLESAWDDLVDCRVFTPEAQGLETYVLDPKTSFEFQYANHAYQCPFTRRVTHRGVLGLTPFLAREMTEERSRYELMRVELPEPALLATIDLPPAAQREREQKLRELRERVAWSEFSDRALTDTGLLTVVEHSAQVPRKELDGYEEKFKAGELNILSCTTTMEMGVDIGALSGVVMNNVPPSPANYLQRAGRAGRRNESAALVTTLCTSSPHPMQIYASPRWAFDARITAPSVQLNSERIIQRHLHAWLLGHYLVNIESGHRTTGLTIGEFVSATDERPEPIANGFERFLESHENDVAINNTIGALSRGTALESIDAETIRTHTKETWTKLRDDWKGFDDTLIAQFVSLEGSPSWIDAKGSTDGKARRYITSSSLKSVQLSLRRHRGEYLVQFLSASGYLPAYGFPTNLVEFVYSTFNNLSAFTGKDGGGASKHGYPSRSLDQALADYVPGTETVIDRNVYSTEGLQLSWQLPSNEQQSHEAQQFLQWSVCEDCGYFDRWTGGVQQAGATCQKCESLLKPPKRTLRPHGFAVDIRAQPQNTLSDSVRPPVATYIRAVEGSSEPVIAVGRKAVQFAATDAELLFLQSGLKNQGYELCLMCGRAHEQPPIKQGKKFSTKIENHSPLRIAKGDRYPDRIDSSGNCRGPEHATRVQTHLHLGGTSRTDLYALRFQEPVDLAGLIAIGAALRQALCKRLGVDTREIRLKVEPFQPLGGMSIILLDATTGGAGYSPRAAELLDELLEDAVAILECREVESERCDSCCHHCVLDYDIGFIDPLANRVKALEFLQPDIDEA